MSRLWRATGDGAAERAKRLPVASSTIWSRVDQDTEASLRPGDVRRVRLPRGHPCVTLSYVMATLTIRLPAQLRRELERLSRERRRAAGDIVRESLRRYLAVERFRELRHKALPFAEAQGFLTDEDVFKSIS